MDRGCWYDIALGGLDEDVNITIIANFSTMGAHVPKLRCGQEYVAVSRFKASSLNKYQEEELEK